MGSSHFAPFPNRYRIVCAPLGRIIPGWHDNFSKDQQRNRVQRPRSDSGVRHIDTEVMQACDSSAAGPVSSTARRTAYLPQQIAQRLCVPLRSAEPPPANAVFEAAALRSAAEPAALYPARTDAAPRLAPQALRSAIRSTDCPTDPFRSVFHNRKEHRIRMALFRPALCRWRECPNALPGRGTAAGRYPRKPEYPWHRWRRSGLPAGPQRLSAPQCRPQVGPPAARIRMAGSTRSEWQVNRWKTGRLPLRWVPRRQIRRVAGLGDRPA